MDDLRTRLKKDLSNQKFTLSRKSILPMRHNWTTHHHIRNRYRVNSVLVYGGCFCLQTALNRLRYVSNESVVFCRLKKNVSMRRAQSGYRNKFYLVWLTSGWSWTILPIISTWFIEPKEDFRYCSNKKSSLLKF